MIKDKFVLNRQTDKNQKDRQKDRQKKRHTKRQREEKTYKKDKKTRKSDRQKDKKVRQTVTQMKGGRQTKKKILILTLRKHKYHVCLLSPL